MSLRIIHVIARRTESDEAIQNKEILILSDEKEERKKDIKAVRTICTLRASTQTAKKSQSSSA